MVLIISRAISSGCTSQDGSESYITAGLGAPLEVSDGGGIQVEVARFEGKPSVGDEDDGD